jgi:hypothetical protein
MLPCNNSAGVVIRIQTSSLMLTRALPRFARAWHAPSSRAHPHGKFSHELPGFSSFSDSDFFARAAAVFRRPCPIVDGQRGIDGNLPTKPSAKIAKRSGVFGAKDDLVFRLQCNDEILAIASHCHLPPVFHGPFPPCGTTIFHPTRGQGCRSTPSTSICADHPCAQSLVISGRVGCSPQGYRGATTTR